MSLGPIIGLEHDSVVRFPVVLPTGNRKTGERQTDHKQKAPSPSPKKKRVESLQEHVHQRKPSSGRDTGNIDTHYREREIGTTPGRTPQHRRKSDVDSLFFPALSE